MNKVLQKRSSLETFIREQTLGPGINGYKYVDINDEILVEKISVQNHHLTMRPKF